MKYEISKIEVGPKEALAMLATMRANRSLSPRHVDMLAEEMSAGRWLPSMLYEDHNHNVVDGQHRLNAVVRSGTIQTFVVIGPVEPSDVAYLVARRQTPAEQVHRAEPDVHLDNGMISVIRLCVHDFGASASAAMRPRDIMRQYVAYKDVYDAWGARIPKVKLVGAFIRAACVAGLCSRSITQTRAIDFVAACEREAVDKHATEFMRWAEKAGSITSCISSGPVRKEAYRRAGCAITGKKFSELAELLPSMRVTGG